MLIFNSGEIMCSNVNWNFFQGAGEMTQLVICLMQKLENLSSDSHVKSWVQWWVSAIPGLVRRYGNIWILVIGQPAYLKPWDLGNLRELVSKYKMDSDWRRHWTLVSGIHPHLLLMGTYSSAPHHVYLFTAWLKWIKEGRCLFEVMIFFQLDVTPSVLFCFVCLRFLPCW